MNYNAVGGIKCSILIDLCADIMPHLMKGIGNDRQDVWHLLPNMWKNL